MDEVLHLEGEIDLSNAELVGAALEEHAQKATGDLIVDCSQVTFMDSSALRCFFAIAGRLKRHRRQLVVTGLQPNVRRTAEVANLDQVAVLQD